ncbi:Hypothetical protein SCLAV_p0979 (plasmid) [Streptomyces clavuligerus]|uniref:Uncharacterized protein n=1 Tax=Streptomyces clavuligerus TaxID=1901 RepID=D5SKM3_STRCL|nr:Hypothetical protein SCLAV_p0979 [Streptomyces clavuligerus]
MIVSGVLSLAVGEVVCPFGRVGRVCPFGWVGQVRRGGQGR